MLKKTQFAFIWHILNFLFQCALINILNKPQSLNVEDEKNYTFYHSFKYI